MKAGRKGHFSRSRTKRLKWRVVTRKRTNGEYDVLIIQPCGWQWEAWINGKGELGVAERLERNCPAIVLSEALATLRIIRAAGKEHNPPPPF